MENRSSHPSHLEEESIHMKMRGARVQSRKNPWRVRKKIYGISSWMGYI